MLYLKMDFNCQVNPIFDSCQITLAHRQLFHKLQPGSEHSADYTWRMQFLRERAGLL
jgi:hypothetical protein